MPPLEMLGYFQRQKRLSEEWVFSGQFCNSKTRYFPMRDETIALCVIDQNRLYWKPSPKFATVFGMRTIDCGPADADASYEIARGLFKQARDLKKRDREQRLLAKADRIRASME
jgi:hypothetical protein